MKLSTVIVLLIFASGSRCLAQPVVDTHPNSTIYAIDYSTGQEALAASDAAVLFKDAYIELVSNTTMAKLARVAPGKKNFVITQMDPQTNGNAYQCILQNKLFGQTTTLLTFIYSVDKNALSFYYAESQSYLNVQIQGPNLNNLTNCATYGKFNIPAPPPPAPEVAMAPPQANVPDNTPADAIDADVSTATVPPALPDYEQPLCPTDGYMWQPGYWAFNVAGGYYWVPGVWVAAPTVGLLWTPPYWGFEGGLYLFHGGYWGNTIGFYGGVNYGYGYGGRGYGGGEWHEGHFRYNTAVVRVNTVVIHNTYEDRTVIVVGERNHTGFNGGPGGIQRRADEHEMAAMHEHHIMATNEQIRNQRAAREDRAQFASSNGGRPGNVAAARPPERTAENMRANEGEHPGGMNGAAARTGAAPGTTPAAGGTTPGGVKPATPGAAAPAGAKPGVPSVPGATGAKSGATTTPGKGLPKVTPPKKKK
jgi:hypothetical protein